MKYEEIIKRLEEILPLLIRGFSITDPRGLSGVDISYSESIALFTLARKDRFKMSELAKELGVSFSSATKYVEKLVKKGLAKREPGEKDRRTVFVYLTAKGKKLAEEIQRKKNYNIKLILKKIPEKDVNTLMGILEKFANIIKERENKK